MRGLLQPGPGRWRAVARVLALVGLIAAGVLYTSHVQRQSEQKWCALLSILTGGPPSTTERGKVVADALDQLRRDFHCPTSRRASP